MRKDMCKRAGVFTILLFLLCAGCRKPAVFYEDGMQEVQKAEQEEKEEVTGKTEAPICVYVCGEVENPGVYELPSQSRIGDAVEAAGGMTEEAQEDWLNLAERLTDGQMIAVPSREEALKILETREQQESGLVNLNTASKEELMTLTGIGASKAEDIVNYREQNGNFSSIEGLMEIPGIKEGVFRKIKDQITV